MKKWFRLYNMDCVSGSKKHIRDGSVDLIITDPPYGIRGDKLHIHYNRDEKHVLDGYVEIPRKEYADFSRKWIREAERILRPGGSIYIVSGYTNLPDILNALRQSSLKEKNHIIWKYNFGVHTRKKFISSHYHILYYVKPGGELTFNTYCRYGPAEKTEENRSRNYRDREDVWIINREYKPGKTKNKNELPAELLKKMIQYSSNEGDVVCDLFLGSFSTAKIAVRMKRKAVGFEISKTAFSYQMKKIKDVVPGELLPTLRKPEKSSLFNQRKPWTEEEKNRVKKRYKELYRKYGRKDKSIQTLSTEFGRGRFALDNILKQMSRRD